MLHTDIWRSKGHTNNSQYRQFLNKNYIFFTILMSFAKMNDGLNEQMNKMNE